ncbi:hypothetical protein [Candidatus Macondimonas diazotrophica]|jgi:hypothetical protein|uniref:Uncharacterized protein n=1 Tax=Candidatus Macondimonas diazotrophica TaxID=2305248 RepID=A0A4Z0F8R4_9GAMM|nr:hypothetical protein [Candidatus Macondimonas diazotrophica]TFZ81673.1 hypothetical protein E4680_11425 [Candidatus Macondimonas diazotrophica]
MKDATIQALHSIQKLLLEATVAYCTISNPLGSTEHNQEVEKLLAKFKEDLRAVEHKFLQGRRTEKATGRPESW